MDVSCILNQNNDSMSVSDVKGNKIYYTNDNILLEYDIFTNEKEMIYKFENSIDQIKIVKARIYVFIGNYCEILSISYQNIINTFQLESVPKKIKVYSDKIYILTQNNKFYELENDQIQEITLFGRNDAIDFSFDEKYGFFLFSNGDVFRVENAYRNQYFNFIMKEKLLSGDFSDDQRTNELDVLLEIEVSRRKLYILHEKGVNVYSIRETYCSISYEYQNDNIFHLHNHNAIFCISQEIILLDQVPLKILKGENLVFIKNFAMNNDFIYILKKKEITFSGDKKYPHLLKEESVEKKVENLFSIIKLSSSYTIEEFREKIIDGLKSIFIHLKTLNDSFNDKVSLIKEKNKKITEEYKKLQIKNKKLEERTVVLNRKIEKLIRERKVEIMKENEKKIQKIRETFDQFKKNAKEQIVESRLQNEVIRKMVKDIFQ